MMLLNKLLNTGISVNLYNVEGERKKAAREKAAKKLTKACVDVGERSYSITENVNGKIVSQTTEIWDKPIEKGECIVVMPEDVDFFNSYVTDLTEMYFGGDRHLASEPAFAELLRSVGRRAPYDDFESKEYDLVPTGIAAKSGIHPQKAERKDIEQFKADMCRAVHVYKDDKDSFIKEAKWLIDRNIQLLPYMLKAAFKSESDPKRTIGVLIDELIGHDTRVEVASYVEENAHDPIHTMLRFISVDGEGLVRDIVHSREDPVVLTDSAQYLIASRAYEEMDKAKKQEDLKRQLSAEVRPNLKHLREGFKQYMHDVLEEITYRSKVGVENGDYTLLPVKTTGPAALIVAVDKSFMKPMAKLAKEFTQINFCKDFTFDPYHRP